MRGIGRTAALLVACALAGALVGCERDPVGPVDPTSAPPSTSASPTPTGPTPPVMPEAARADTAEGAVAFVEHYIELLNYAANTGEVGPLKAASANCDGCDKYASLYEQIYDDGGYLRDPGWDPIAPFAQQEGQLFTVVTEVSAPAVTTVRAAGAAPEIGSDAKYSLRFQLARQADSWRTVLLQGSSV